MKAWLSSRSPSEQRVLITGLFALSLWLIYSLLWDPLYRDVRHLRISIQNQAETLAWMRNAQGEILRLRGSSRRATRAMNPQPLLTVVDRTLGDAHLRDAVRRLQPRDDSHVQLWMEGAAFDPLVQWLATLSSQHRVSVVAVSMQRRTLPGTVDVHVSVQATKGQ